MSRRRVVITGLGVVSPLGRELSEFRRNLLSGSSAAAPITVFDPARLPTTIAAQVDAASLPIQTADRKIAFGLVAARAAADDADLAAARSASEHYAGMGGGLSLGIGLELFSMPDMVEFVGRGEAPAGADPRTFLQTPADACAHLICRRHELREPPLTHVSACAAATDAVGAAFRMIRDGRRRWMLAGGVDSMINPLGLGGFCAIEATTRRNHEPQRASRPFDRDRDGFLLGEGAGLLVLETLEDARARDARVYAEVVGYGNSFDAHGISEPHPEGEGALLAMRRALSDAGLRPEDISYINAHGTSTPKNDVVETRAIRRLFGPHAERVPVSSTKSMLGHLISAAGAVELAAAILCAEAGWVHPTINLERPDPACDLDYVAEGARRVKVETILKNSFAFGGQNASLVVRMGVC
ncbi:MAG TPA: beta-ketoacyl-[acyl-carrier-protein] synthase family protein [Pyrinomonadaceae bacterium]|nr:beta-ketoacyl-[acyl-carrier-protein] synthase family protein [Pyrinomonadaceae bacterium]